MQLKFFPSKNQHFRHMPLVLVEKQKKETKLKKKKKKKKRKSF